MDKIKVLVIGGTGLVGSCFVENYKNNLEIITAGRNNTDFQIDLLDPDQIKKVITNSDTQHVVNFAAYTGVDAAEKQKDDLKGDIYKLNVLAPGYLAKACLETNKKLHHISTDYVFDGTKSDKPYTETDKPNPSSSWYSKTKYGGELKVQEVFQDNNFFTIIRISFPFNASYKRRPDIARAVVERLKSGQEYRGITDQKIKPTNTDDIASGIYFIIKNNLSGIFHVAGHYKNGYISPFEFATRIAEKFNLDKSLIKPASFFEYYNDKYAKRPQNTWLDTAKIENLGMKFLTEEESLENFKKDYLESQ